MEPIENTNNENLQDEIVTVEPGDEIKSVEDEIKDATPVVEEENKAESESEAETEPEEKPEEPKENESDKEESEESSEDTEQDVQEEENKEENQEDSEEKQADESDEADKPDEESEEDKEEDEQPNDEPSELDKVKAELEQMKEAEEVRKMEVAREKAIAEASKTYDDFNDKLAHAVEDTFRQYGIDPNSSIEDLQKDPAKMQIVQDIVANAQRIQAEKQAELMKPITDASNALIFRQASKEMAKFDLTEEQTTVAAQTLINIFDATGLANLSDDLKAKVELAVARAKMIAPKVEKVVDEVKEIAEDTKKAIEDVANETAEKPEENEKAEEDKKEDVQKEEEPKEPEVKEEKPSLDAFKESASVGEANTSLGDGVDVDNVLQKLAALPFRERTRFLVEHADLINEAGRRNRAQGR